MSLSPSSPSRRRPPNDAIRTHPLPDTINLNAETFFGAGTFYAMFFGSSISFDVAKFMCATCVDHARIHPHTTGWSA